MQRLHIPRRIVPELALLAASVLWGASFLATKIGMESTGPLGFVALRYLMATVAFALVLPRATRGIGATEMVAGIVVAATASIAYGAQAYALQTTDTGRVAFLSALYVPLVPVLQLLFFRQRGAAGIWIGVVLACLGVAIMSGLSPADITLSYGDTLSIVGAVAIAVEVVILGYYVRRADPLRIAFVMMVTTTLLCAAFALATGEPMPVASPTLFWVVVGYGIATAYIQFAMSWAQAQVDSSRAAIIYALEPVFGGLFGYAAGEIFGLSDVVGALVILAGVIIASLPRLVDRLLMRRPVRTPVRLADRPMTETSP
ncbi:DMT family transporter [Qipengyuania sp. XHP0211]|uniref:DMT family transporter n=1 Tax=Qipengyuania sp. XHP0211 TaxID=3038079 RepID=UPI00241E91AC|nr:DMT family transporter [Qipengyuania sp. XHP0211]MDG5750273.1 DMT family transporter [Qipengyuania sp. XHP0211]